MAIAHKDVGLRALTNILSAKQVVTSLEDLLTYDGDAGLDRGMPDGVVFPRSTADVVKIVQWAKDQQVPLIARGAGTGLSGGAVAEYGGVIVSFARMEEVLEFDTVGRSAIVQPGLITLQLENLVKTKGLYYPPDPSSGRSSTIGGNLAENSGGPHCFKYGVTTNYVTGLQVVLADGRVVQLGGRALDYPEYDLLGLMVGSEGTLGIITEAYVRLMRNPPAVKTMMAAFDSVEQAGAAVSAIIARGLVPATLEMMDQKIMRILEDFTHAGLPIHAGAALIIEADGYPESVTPQIEEFSAILEEHAAQDLRIAQSEEERANIWYARKSAAGAIARLAPAFYLVDGTVPRSKLAKTLAEVNRICESYELRVGYVFHAGDGNLHPLILIEDTKDNELIQRVIDAGRDIVKLCVDEGGSITGEHGVGIEKRAFMPLMYSGEELDAMLDVKTVFDPQNLLNPAKIFPPDAPTAAPLPPPSDPPVSPFAPASALEVAEALCAWAAAGQRVRVRGGGTKSGWLPATEALLSTENLRGIKTYALEDLYVTVGAGTPLAELQAALARDNMMVPLVSPWADATVGGIAATNINAPLRMRYGGLRDLVLAATVALPNGRVIRAGRPVVKNVAGYDLPKLLVGSHGTLGVLADVTLKLVPVPRRRSTLVIPVEGLSQALDWGNRLLQVCFIASALLLCRGCQVAGTTAPYALVYTAEGVTEDVQTEFEQVRSALQAAGATTIQQTDALVGSDVWAGFVSNDPAVVHGASASQSTLQVGVAPKDLAHLLDSMAAVMEATAFVADLASGLLYVRADQQIETLRQTACEMGGYARMLTGPAEPRDTLDMWGHTPDGLDLMQAIKSRWDGQGILNPDAFMV